MPPTLLEEVSLLYKGVGGTYPIKKKK